MITYLHCEMSIPTLASCSHYSHSAVKMLKVFPPAHSQARLPTSTQHACAGSQSPWLSVCVGTRAQMPSCCGLHCQQVRSGSLCFEWLPVFAICSVCAW